MHECPFCLTHVREIGGIALMTPNQITRANTGMVLPGTQEPIIGSVCADCLGIIAITLDGLRNGRINALIEKYTLSGAIKRN